MQRLEREGLASDDGADVRARFAVLGRSTLPEEIANRLLALIRAQELRPGDKLPAERTLAAMMDVSRPVLREALRALSIMRVVDIRQGSGTYITSLEPKQLVSHLDLVFSRDTPALVQVLEARAVVEVGNARLAATRIGQPELDHLDHILAELDTAVDDPDRFSDVDIAFHNALAAAAGNFLLEQFMAAINTLAKASRQRTGTDRSLREATMRDHGRILEALRNRDPDAAARAMAEHIEQVERALESSAGSEQPDGGAMASERSR